MANSYVEIPVTGVDSYTFSFPYLEQSHIKIYAGGVLQTQGVHYTFTDSNTIEFSVGNVPTDTNTIILIQRVTDGDGRLVTYSNTGLDADDLNLGSNQNFYLAQEAIDAANLNVTKGTDGITSVDGRLTNVEDPIDAQDAATKAYVASQLTQSATGGVYIQATAPTATGLNEGDLWVDTDTGIMSVWTSTGWANGGTVESETFHYTGADVVPIGLVYIIPVLSMGAANIDQVFLNGVFLKECTTAIDFTTGDWDRTTGFITFQNALASDDVITITTTTRMSEVLTNAIMNVSGNLDTILQLATAGSVNGITLKEQFTATAGQQLFNLTNSYIQAQNNISVYVNGVLQTAYVETSTSSVTLINPASLGDEVVFIINEHSVSTTVTESDNVTYTPAGTGAVATTVQEKLRETISVKDFGAVGDGVTDDTAAIQAAIDYAESNNIVVNLDGATYAIGNTIYLKNGVSLIGTHMPSSDPVSVGVGTTFLRIANIDILRSVGTNRTTNRIGHNRIQGIQFKDGINIGTTTWTNFKYSDSVVWQDVTFLQSDSNTIIGTCITAEESWDWRLNNIIWKHCGDSTGAKYPIRIYNGEDDSSNDWTFHQCRWQESKGNNIFFDSTGAGNTNAFFWFSQCKFEDTGNGSLTNFKGKVNKLFVNQTQFGGCGESHIVMPSTSRDWHFNECLFANGAGTPTQMVSVSGSQISIKQCHFQNPAESVLTFVDGSGAICTISDCTTDGLVPLVPDTGGIPVTWRIGDNAYNYMTSNSGSATIGAGSSNVIVTHGLSYIPRMEDITLTISGLPNNGIVGVIPSAIDATTFRIYGANSTGSTQATTLALNVAWNIRRSRG